MRTLEKMELGLFFCIGTQAFDPDRDDEAEYRVIHAAWDAVDKKLKDIPGATILFDYHGNETTIETPESSRSLRVELCELGGEGDVINGQMAYGLHFYSSKEIELPLARALKALCENELKAAGGETPVTFAKAQVYKIWHDTERLDWPEV